MFILSYFSQVILVIGIAGNHSGLDCYSCILLVPGTAESTKLEVKSMNHRP